MYSSSTPIVYGSPRPKRWSRTLDSYSGDDCIDVDLQVPSRIDEPRDDHGRVDWADVAKDLAVGTAHLVEVGLPA